MAVWVEDSQGNYIATLYATSKIVYQNWGKDANNGQIKRDEALPYWTHKKGSAQIVPDTVTSATSKGNSTINTKLNTTNDTYLIIAEINQSTDFNDYYPKEAKQGDDNYSGGINGSGQPAIVYAATINAADNKTFELLPIGQSSPDGSNGNLYKDLSKLTTAKDIISKITFAIK